MDKRVLDRINFLRQEIEKHNEAYYDRDEPLISDEAYDKLYQELQYLERQYNMSIPADSPTQKAGGRAVGPKLIRHREPMISIETETDYTNQGAHNFVRRVKLSLPAANQQEDMFIAELKFDGLAMNLRYVKGMLESAALRGNTIEGEDVTGCALTISDIPHVLRGCELEEVNIRGEVYLKRSRLQAINDELIEQGEKPLRNARNAAAGSLRQSDPEVCAKRGLSFFAYEILETEWPDRHIKTQSDLMDLARKFGFKTSPMVSYTSDAAALARFHDLVLTERDRLDFDIDGVVYKVNSLEHQRLLGSRSREPLWAVAHKFPPYESTTDLIDIRNQVSRTGVITPVAVLKPIQVSGVTISSALLHNAAEIRRRNIKIGDKVIVRRAGDVIPEVVGPVLLLREGDEEDYEVPAACPVCGAPVVVESENTARCTGSIACSAQRVGALTHFVSKSAMNIMGLGDKTIEGLVELDLVREVPDLYGLSAQELNCVAGVGAKFSQKLIQAIDQSRHTTLAAFIYALGISGVGIAKARTLARRFGDIRALMDADMRSLEELDDIGPIVAGNIREFFIDPRRLDIVERLLEVGITFEPMGAEEVLQDLFGKTFVVTGTFANYTRDEIKALLELRGAKVTSAVSKHTSCLIAGETAGTKLTRAQELGIEVIDESGLDKLSDSPF